MKQKVLKIEVLDNQGHVLFQKDPAVPDHVIPTLALFGDVGNKVTIEFYEFQVELPAESNA